MPILTGMTVGFQQKNPLLLGRDMTARGQLLDRMINVARRQAAQTATEATRRGFVYKRTTRVPTRPGRQSTNGRFRDYLEWKPAPGGVEFDTATADAQVPYWIIQEIGTGESARLLRGGQKAGPGEKAKRGAPKKGTTYVKTIPSQIGRRIPASLVWATGPRGSYVPPGPQQGQQLQLRSRINQRSLTGPPSAMYISREIKGQDFVQEGAIAGYGEYKKSVLAAARLAFAGHRYRP